MIMMLHRQVGLLVVLVVLFISLPLAVSWRQRWRLRAGVRSTSRTHTAAATLTLATSLLSLNVSPTIAAPAADGKAALQMVTSSRDQLKKVSIEVCLSTYPSAFLSMYCIYVSIFMIPRNATHLLLFYRF